MALYERLLGRDDLGRDVKAKIPVHQFIAILAEHARGRLSGAQANALIDRISGEPLSAAERTEAQALLATFTGTGTQKLGRAKEVDDVLCLAEALPGPYSGTEPYDTPAQVKLRLGV